MCIFARPDSHNQHGRLFDALDEETQTAEDVEDLSVEVGEGVLGKEQGEERRGTALSVDCVTTFSSPLLREIRSRGISLARSLAKEVYLRAWCVDETWW